MGASIKYLRRMNAARPAAGPRRTKIAACGRRNQTRAYLVVRAMPSRHLLLSSRIRRRGCTGRSRQERKVSFPAIAGTA